MPPAFKGSVELVIQSRHGKNIERWSEYPDEQEVTFKLGTAFRVIDAYEEDGRYIIKMVEIGDGEMTDG